MYYISTRGGYGPVKSAQAIKMGIAPDGGLFVPDIPVRLPQEEIFQLEGMPYQQIAAKILAKYLDDYTLEELEECVNKAYNSSTFDSCDIAPVRKLTDTAYILELWHGPTCAFKDMALQILPHLLVKALNKTGEKDEIVILVATSGDTGKAALEGFKDVDGTKVIVFFPEKGVSQMQRLQMITQEGENVHSVSVAGNFDDAQNGVKAIFTDTCLLENMKSQGYKFSSANSINWGRLVPQIVYYFSAYLGMVKNDEINPGDMINIVVPTGNFGNILAAYYAMEMGLPVNRLICASNANNVLTDFINTGVYSRNRDFKKTISPSMDILISSNLERLLFEMTRHKPDLVRNWMARLAETGEYSVDEATMSKISKVFWAGYSSENETLDTIRCVYNDYSYVVDPHTAVAIDVYDKYVISTGDMTKTIIASTASPLKFNESVVRGIFGEEETRGKDEFQLLDKLVESCHIPVPEGLKDLDKREIKHQISCGKDEMASVVQDILDINF